ncbi:hypothetical protein ACS0PU_006650 [Formica fusca]
MDKILRYYAIFKYYIARRSCRTPLLLICKTSTHNTLVNILEVESIKDVERRISPMKRVLVRFLENRCTRVFRLARLYSNHAIKM